MSDSIQNILCSLPKSDKEIIESFLDQLKRKAEDLSCELKNKSLYTKPTQTQQMLREREEQLRITLNSIGDGVIATDTNGIVTTINTIAANLTGWKEQTAIGKPIGDVFNIVNEQTREPAKIPVDDVLRLGKIVGLANHTVLISKDGIEVPIADSAAPILDKQGNTSGVVMVFQDHTEERKARNLIESSEQKYRELFDNVPVGFAVHEMIFDASEVPIDYRFLQVNPMFEKLTGLKAENLVGNTVKEIMPGTEDSWIKRFGTVVKTGKTSTFENYSSELHKYYRVRAFRTAPNQFGVAFSDITTHKNIEKQLRQTQFVVDNFSDVVIWSNKLGDIIYVNEVACSLYGYTEDELLTMHIYDLDNENTHRDWQRIWEELKNKGRDKIERVHIKKSKTTFPVEVAKNFLKFEDEELICSVIRDISKQKQMQDAIEKRIVSLTSPGDEVKNITFEELFDINEIQQTQNNFAEAMGLSSIIIHPDGTPITAPSNYPKLCYQVMDYLDIDFEQYYKSRTEYEQDTAYICPNSGLWELSAHIYADKKHIASWIFGQVRNDNHTEEHMKRQAEKLGVDEKMFAKAFRKVPTMSPEQLEKTSNALEELTKRLSKSALQNIQQARFIANENKKNKELRRLSVAINQFTDSVVITDADGNIEYVNPAFEKITGYTKEEAIGENPRVLKSDRHDDEFYKNMWDTITAKKTWEGRIINKKKNGDIYTEFATISPVTDANMYITNFVAIKRDITEDIVRENKMQHAEKMEAVGQLAGGIAHDFNNIMQVIIGFSELLAVDISHDESAMTSLDEIQKAADHAFDLTKQLLLFSRDENIKTKQIDLNNTINNTLQIIQSAVGENIKISTTLEPELYVVKANNQQIERIIINMAINARDAMPDGGNLDIQTKNVMFDSKDKKVNPSIFAGTFVCLSINDTGQGMTEEVKNHIFEPFFTTKGRAKGTGLGLASTYATIQRYNGWINTYSEVGKGTTFRIYIPASSKQVQNLTIEEAQNQTNNAGHGEQILVVEDDESIRKLMTTALTNSGYRISTASNAEDAERIFNDHSGHFDLLISDIILPGKSGVELAETLGKARANMPILLCSGYSEDRIHKSLLNKKGFNFLEKPFSLKNFLKKVEEILKR